MYSFSNSCRASSSLMCPSSISSITASKRGRICIESSYQFKTKDFRRQLIDRLPVKTFEIVAHILLVERRLRLTGLVTVGRPEARRIRCQDFVDQNNSTVTI